MAGGKKGPAKIGKKSARGVEEPEVGYRAFSEQDARAWAARVQFGRATCEEASMLSRERYIPCGAPAAAVVWHEKDRRAYQMCEACADHNVRNRGGKLLASRPEQAARKLAPVPDSAMKQFGARIAPQIHIPTAAVLAVKALQQERKALEGKLELIKKDLKAQEPPIIAALEAGLPTELGCPPCAVDVEERITPGWKAEALILAAAAGKNVEVYEAEIRAKTAPTVIKRLIINGREGK